MAEIRRPPRIVPTRPTPPPPDRRKKDRRKRDLRLDLRWGIMFKGRLIMACASKKRAKMLVEIGNVDTPGGGVTLRDFGLQSGD